MVKVIDLHPGIKGSLPVGNAAHYIAGCYPAMVTTRDVNQPVYLLT